MNPAAPVTVTSAIVALLRSRPRAEGSAVATQAARRVCACAAIVAAVTSGVFACKKPPPEPTLDAKTAFESVCAKCHGADGRGGLPIYEGGPSPRNFTDPEFQRAHTDEDIKRTIREGKPPGMPPFGTTFTPAQLDGLVACVRAFEAKGR